MDGARMRRCSTRGVWGRQRQFRTFGECCADDRRRAADLGSRRSGIRLQATGERRRRRRAAVRCRWPAALGTIRFGDRRAKWRSVRCRCRHLLGYRHSCDGRHDRCSSSAVRHHRSTEAGWFEWAAGDNRQPIQRCASRRGVRLYPERSGSRRGQLDVLGSESPRVVDVRFEDRGVAGDAYRERGRYLSQHRHLRFGWAELGVVGAHRARRSRYPARIMRPRFRERLPLPPWRERGTRSRLQRRTRMATA